MTYYVNPAVSWIFILGIILGVAFYLWSKQRTASMVEDALSPRLADPYQHTDPPCPCTTDPNYHEWVALMLIIEDESRDREDHR